MLSTYGLSEGESRVCACVCAHAGNASLISQKIKSSISHLSHLLMETKMLFKTAGCLLLVPVFSCGGERTVKHKSNCRVPGPEQGVSHQQSNSSNNPVKIKRLGLGKAPGTFPIGELSGHRLELRSPQLLSPANVESVSWRKRRYSYPRR